MFYHHFLPHLSATIGIIHPAPADVNVFLKKFAIFLEGYNKNNNDSYLTKKWLEDILDSRQKGDSEVDHADHT